MKEEAQQLLPKERELLFFVFKIVLKIIVFKREMPHLTEPLTKLTKLFS